MEAGEVSRLPSPSLSPLIFSVGIFFLFFSELVQFRVRVRVVPTFHLPRLSLWVRVRVRVVLETETPFAILFFTTIRVRVRIEPFA